MIKKFLYRFLPDIYERFEKEAKRKLEIGSGFNPHEGYDHLDVNPICPHLEFIATMDKLPISDEAYDKILAVHVIEHYPWNKQIDLSLIHI